MESIFSWIKDNPDINRESKLILYITFGIVPAFLVGFVIWTWMFPENRKENFLKRRSEEMFNGRVDTLYYDLQNHNTKTAILSSGSSFELFREWDNLVSKGDSLEKKKGSIIVNVYKITGDTLILNYKAATDSWK